MFGYILVSVSLIFIIVGSILLRKNKKKSHKRGKAEITEIIRLDNNDRKFEYKMDTIHLMNPVNFNCNGSDVISRKDYEYSFNRYNVGNLIDIFYFAENCDGGTTTKSKINTHKKMSPLIGIFMLILGILMLLGSGIFVVVNN